MVRIDNALTGSGILISSSNKFKLIQLDKEYVR
jgi:hypothetical protein